MEENPAIIESRRLMLSSNNMLTPSSGEPIVAPTLDIVLGCFYLTGQDDEENNIKLYSNFDEVLLAYNLGFINLRSSVKVRNSKSENNEIITTFTVVGGLLIFIGITLAVKSLQKTKLSV